MQHVVTRDVVAHLDDGDARPQQRSLDRHAQPARPGAHDQHLAEEPGSSSSGECASQGDSKRPKVVTFELDDQRCMRSIDSASFEDNRQLLFFAKEGVAVRKNWKVNQAYPGVSRIRLHSTTF